MHNDGPQNKWTLVLSLLPLKRWEMLEAAPPLHMPLATSRDMLRLGRLATIRSFCRDSKTKCQNCCKAGGDAVICELISRNG